MSKSTQSTYSVHDLPFKQFLQLTVLPLIFIALLGIGLTLRISDTTNLRHNLLVEQSIKNTIVSQRSVANLELLRVYLGAIEYAMNPKLAHEAYVNAWGLLADSSLERGDRTQEAMLHLMDGVRKIWHERLLIDNTRQQIDAQWQALNKTLITITSLTMTENKNQSQRASTEQILQLPSLATFNEENVVVHLQRLDQHLGTVCSKEYEPNNLNNAVIFRSKCDLTSEQIKQIKDTLNVLDGYKQHFKHDVASISNEAIALRRIYAEEESREMVSDIDRVHKLSDRTGLSFFLLFIALAFTCALLILFYGVVFKPLRSIIKTMKAFETDDKLINEQPNSRIREINMIITWVMRFCHMTRVEREKANALSNAYQQLLLRAHLDPLMGVGNRQFLEDAIHNNVTVHPNTGVIMLDLDHFKTINDEKGHLFGDTVLKTLGDVLKNAVSQSEAIYRYGGDELCIIVPNTSSEKMEKLAQRLSKEVGYISRDTGKLESLIPENSLTLSLGLSSISYDEEKDLLTLIKEADSALYDAKHSGRNCYRLYKN